MLFILFFSFVFENATPEDFWINKGPNNSGGARVINWISNNYILTGGTVGIAVTTNMGISWDRIFSSPSEISCIARNDTNGTLFMCYYYGYVQNSGLYRSYNNGYSWSLSGLYSTTGKRILDVKVKGNGIIFCASKDIDYPGGSGGVDRSTDNGNTWTSVL
ncbi:MAG: hypothetical protein NTV87_12910 [Ignavibacteriae bacterium]|nr:hypothetical protein [Ignavibacteriota bacterium]